MLRAFRSELPKFSRWMVLAGIPVMVAVTISLPYFALSRALTSTDTPIKNLPQILPTTQGLITLLSFAQKFTVAVAVTMVAANLAAEWSQGTLRNLLVREPGRLRWLSGKMLALLLFVILSTTLAIFISTGVILLLAGSYGISTAPWLTWEGVGIFFLYLGNELLGLVGISLLGMFIAVLTRSIGIAVGISVAYVLIAEDLAQAVWKDGATWLPVHLFDYLWGTESHFSMGVPPMGYGADLIVALLWMVGFVLVSAIAFRRMDINA